MFEVLPLSSLVEKQQGGGTPPRNDPAFWHGDIPWASVKDFKDDQLELQATEETISNLGLRSSTSNLIPPGTPMVCTRMAVGRCAVSPTPTAINQDVRALYPKKEVNPRYLLRLVSSLQGRAESLSVGSTVKGIRSSDFLAIKAHIAPDNEQGAIANILDTLDTQIQKTEALIAKLEKVKEGLLHDLLTRGIDEHGQLRPGPEKAPELYNESPLGLIPKLWNTAKLSDLILEHNSGLYTPKSSYGRGTPMLGVSSLYSMDVLQNQELRRAPIHNSMLNKYILKEGDIVYGESSLVLSGIAKTVVVGELGEGKGFEWHTRRIRVDKTTAHPGFISTQLSHFQPVRKKIMSVATQTALTGMTTKDFFSVSVVLPEINEQKLIFERLGKIEKRGKEENSKLIKMKSLKKGLMDDLLTGRVRVTPLLERAQITTPA